MATTTNTNKGKQDMGSTGSGSMGSGSMGSGSMGGSSSGGMMDSAKQAASGAMDTARSTASNIGHKAEDATHAAGSGMKSLADTLRDKAPQGGMLGGVAGSLANCLESSGQYLQQEGLSGMAGDMTNLIRRNPIPAMFVGMGIGFMLARVTSRS